MSVNSSASSTSPLPFGLDCIVVEPFSIVFTAFTTTVVVLLLPLYILVLYHGLRRGQQQRCSSMAAARTSHSDCFTYHLVAMEIVFVFGCFICCCGIYAKVLHMSRVGIHLFTIAWYGEAFFHTLTCLEHYLAVVYPVVYLSLRNEQWLIIRKISIVCVWLLSTGGSVLIMLDSICIIFIFCILIPALLIISFCCVCVLCALIRPGPGSQGRVDQSKQRAFYTIAAMLVVLFLRCFWNMVWVVFYVLHKGTGICVFVTLEMWINFPSSLVLPLLFLQKAGVLACCKNIK